MEICQIVFVLGREEWIPRGEFYQDTAQRPHVDGSAVSRSTPDLGSTVPPRLDVGKDLLVDKARQAEVDDLDLSVIHQQYVLGLEITVDDVLFTQIFETFDDVSSDLLYAFGIKPTEPVGLQLIVEVAKPHLEGDAEVVSERERVQHLDAGVLLVGVLVPEHIEHLDLHLALSVEALLVAYDLERHELLGGVVVGLVDVAERTLSQFGQDLVPVLDVVVIRGEVPRVRVVVAKVAVRPCSSKDLLGLVAEEPDDRVFMDFALLKVGEHLAIAAGGLGRGHLGGVLTAVVTLHR